MDTMEFCRKEMEKDTIEMEEISKFDKAYNDFLEMVARRRTEMQQKGEPWLTEPFEEPMIK